ncbi:alkaline phosphatase PhoX [Marinobacterium rhizophilum]|uniref:alkaline phosphatase PhoX n=1 Tax=Marinobacterium rhizophilum TaxID=420402 RepID=UPI00039A46CD|nr:alkaline phosphatase PhoX [Marinobacterium rhizophilum]
MSQMSRRQFVSLVSIAAAGTALSPLGLLHSRRAMADSGCFPTSFTVEGFGAIAPKLPVNSFELGTLANTELLKLPQGFSYTAISIKGTPMSDGSLVPEKHDGMGCFQGREGNYILVRNHECSIGSNLKCVAPNGDNYDNFAAGLAGGGTTTVIVDRNGRVVKDYVSLGGTIRNCAGGETPWGSWISCEENMTTPSSDDRATVKHGYNFEVPSMAGEAVEPVPLKDMGRMNHEAIAVDPQTGYVYETEDRGDSAFYRFVPHVRPNGFGDLQQGGDLYAMVIDSEQFSDCNADPLPVSEVQGGLQVDTRGLSRGASDSMLPFLGQELKVRWVKLDDVDPQEDTLRHEAQAKGAAMFYRGEGAWTHHNEIYFVASNAGDAGEGQVWCYNPRSEIIKLVVESTEESLLDGPDNITVARDGTLYLCEDGSSAYGQFIVGVDASGGLFQFAHNNYDNGEFCGACFSPDGKFMFVNSQAVGVTYAIWRDDGRSIYL